MEAMKLSDLDRENIEVLEALDVSENALFLLLCRYFAYRNKRLDVALTSSLHVPLQLRGLLQVPLWSTRAGTVSDAPMTHIAIVPLAGTRKAAYTAACALLLPATWASHRRRTLDFGQVVTSRDDPSNCLPPSMLDVRQYFPMP